ncbi:hypothetical protein [Terriglobus saanensis]|uniref:Uncharacterized protein n=1 Tax=Terriglobus saanensis (strain ATCC BAA-1853 / DSM 23119 / SP1PR4) TaxID=401053 RepID=E8V6D7_TERSS|nr:hypothetical protein [Terriglobus saanensis]ADV81602.1 hypothetical protein AciPR4_0769 [Terriglobus saanensis SP1PR4]
MYELHLFVLAVQKCLAWLPTAFVVFGVSVLTAYAFTYTNKQLAQGPNGEATSGSSQSWHHSHRVRDFVIGVTGMCVLAAAAH